jgi:endonuclease/exonuclease/phosphatase family metal-dependent hydrolase
MNKFLKAALYVIGAIAVLLGLFYGFVYVVSAHPNDEEPAVVNCPNDAPELQAGQSIKIYNQNVQFMAGKDYQFFFEGGSDTRPSPEDIDKTLDKLAATIIDENPDIILLQEVDDGAKRTDQEDQLAELLSRLPTEYQCTASAWYWKVKFNIHPKILGSNGMKLSIISKYKISNGIRHQLALVPSNWIVQQLNIKRSLLDAVMPLEGYDGDFHALNTHLEAFAAGTDTLEQQVNEVDGILAELGGQNAPWIISGDFNLLPPGQYEDLDPSQRYLYNPQTELKELTNNYNVVPSLEEMTGPDKAKWYTHWPNDPTVTGPDRTIDYIFYSDLLTLMDHYVRGEDTLDISDHIPLIAEFALPQ